MSTAKTKKNRKPPPNYLLIDLVEQKGFILTDLSAIVNMTKLSRYLLEDRLKSGFHWAGRYVVCKGPEVIISQRHNADTFRKIVQQ